MILLPLLLSPKTLCLGSLLAAFWEPSGPRLDRQAADTGFPLSSRLWFQELLARGSRGAVGCGEQKANSRRAEQREPPASRRYVPARPVFPTLFFWEAGG